MGIFPQVIGRRLGGLKALSGLKWQEIAELLEVSGQAILLWRKGERKPSGANILAITEFTRSIPGDIELLCQSDPGALTLCVSGGDSGG